MTVLDKFLTDAERRRIDAEQIDAYICAKADFDRCQSRLQDAAEAVDRLPRGVYVGTLGAIVVTEDYQNIHPRIWVEPHVVVAAECEGA